MFNPTGVGLMAYVFAFALATGVAFGAVWSYVPLTIGFLALLIGEARA